MAYSSEIYAYVENEFKKRRQKAIDDLVLQKQTIYIHLPELYEIDEKLAETGLSLIISAFSNNREEDDYESFENLKQSFKRIKSANIQLQRRRREILISNGYPPDILSPKYACFKCNDEGYYEDGGMCVCFRNALKKYAVEQLSFGQDFKQQTFDNFNFDFYPLEKVLGSPYSPRENIKNIFDVCKNYAYNFEKENSSLVFVGKTGLGKTYLSAAIAQVVTALGFSVVYDTAQNIFTVYESAKFSHDSNASSKIEAYNDCDLLIIDDLGAEFTTQFTVSCLYNLLSNRTMYSKKMIISTNQDLSTLESIYGARIVSRLIGDFQLLEFFGKDIRQQKIINI